MTTRQRPQRTFLLTVIAPLIVLVGAACGSQSQPAPPNPPTAPGNRLAILAPTVVLESSDPGYLQIDACPDTGGVCSGVTWAGDANLYGPNANNLGDDHDLNLSANPQTPSHSINFPTGPGGSTYIDWLDLVIDPNDPTKSDRFNKHFRSDWNAGQDPSAFPGSNSCVGSANVLDKMNLTYVSVSNNPQDAYFAVQRRDNSGDTGYMWIFNKLPPPSFADGGASLLGTNDGLGDNCSATSYPLVFWVNDADVLFRGHFAPSSDEPLLSVYKVQYPVIASTKVYDGNTVFSAALDSKSGLYYVAMPAKSAINWQIMVSDANHPLPAHVTCDTLNSTLSQYCFWKEGTATFVDGAAVNTSIAGLGALGDTANTITGGIAKVGINGWLANGATHKIGTGQSAQTWQCTDSVGGCMPENLFAEVAVKISTFVSGSVCGATFYGSVISRSSGTTPSPDMKDLAGPYQFNFGNPTISEVVTPLCGTSTDAKFNFHRGAYIDATGGTVTPSTCYWFLDCLTNGTVCDITNHPTCDFTPGGAGPTSNCVFSTSCSTTDAAATVPKGTHNVTLYVTDNLCSATTSPKSVTVNPLPSVTAKLTSACTNFGTAAAPEIGFSYGLDPNVTPNPVSYGTATFYAWSFTGGYTNTSTSASGSVNDISATNYTPTAISGDLTFYDKRAAVAGVTDGVGDGVLCPGDAAGTANCCKATSSSSTTPYLPLGIQIAPTSSGFVCNGVTCSPPTVSGTLSTWGTPPNSDAITFAPSAGPTGGSGKYLYQWTDGTSNLTDTTCGGAGTATSNQCAFNPPDTTFCVGQTFALKVIDQCKAASNISGCPPGGTACVDQTSNTSHYSKVTQVYAY